MSQFNSPTYEIERPSDRCALTGAHLVPGEPYVATLVELDDKQIAQIKADHSRDSKAVAAAALGMQRLDICWGAWQKGKRPDNVFSFWKTTVSQPNKKRKLFVDDDVLMNLFRRLADEEDAQRLAFRFVLGLILMRKKLLRYDGTQRRQSGDASQEWWQVTPKLNLSKGPLGKWNEDDKLHMLDPHLDAPQVQQVTEQLSDILEAEL